MWFFIMAKVTEQAIINLGGISAVRKIIEDRPSDEIRWYVHEHSHITGKIGFYADKFYIGIHDINTHYKIEDLKAALLDLEQKK